MKQSPNNKNPSHLPSMWTFVFLTWHQLPAATAATSAPGLVRTQCVHIWKEMTSTLSSQPRLQSLHKEWPVGDLLVRFSLGQQDHWRPPCAVPELQTNDSLCLPKENHCLCKWGLNSMSVSITWLLSQRFTVGVSLKGPDNQMVHAHRKRNLKDRGLVGCLSVVKRGLPVFVDADWASSVKFNYFHSIFSALPRFCFIISKYKLKLPIIFQSLPLTSFRAHWKLFIFNKAPFCLLHGS